MLITENQLRVIIRKQLIKEDSMFSMNKDIKPGETLSYGGSNASVTILSNPVQEKISKEYYVLVKWDSSDTPNKRFKDLSKKAWNKDVFALFHGGRYDDDHKAKLMTSRWLTKQYPVDSGKVVMKNTVNKLKKAWDEGRIAAVSTKFLQSNEEFVKQVKDGGTWTDFAVDTAVPAVAAIGELFAVLAAGSVAFAPLAPVFKGVSDSANVIDAMRKLTKADFLGCGLALIGILPGIGDEITIIGNGVKKLGTAAASKVMGKTVIKDLIRLLGKIIDSDLITTLKEIVYSFANDRKINPDSLFSNIKNALSGFKIALEFEIEREQKEAEVLISAVKKIDSKAKALVSTAAEKVVSKK